MLIRMDENVDALTLSIFGSALQSTGYLLLVGSVIAAAGVTGLWIWLFNRRPSEGH